MLNESEKRLPLNGAVARHRRRSAWHWTSLLRMSFGVFFLVLGVLGLFLPVLQGVFFLAVGIALLADHIPIFARLRNTIYHRFPRFEHAVQRVRRLPQRFKAFRRRK